MGPEEDNEQALRRWLEEAFPASEGYTIERRGDIDRNAGTNREKNAELRVKRGSHVVSALHPTSTFLETTSPDDIPELMRQWRVAEILREELASQSKVLWLLTNGAELRPTN